MELQEKIVTLRKLTAKEGMYLTQSAEEVSERIFARTINLGQGELVENWREATEEEKNEYDVTLKARLEELSNL